MESKILELTDKYNVEIDLKYKRNSIVATIYDNGEIVSIIQNGFIINMIEEIEKKCKEILVKRVKKYKELNDRLKNINPNIFPDTLFSK